MSEPKPVYETLTIQEIYRLRHWAGKIKNRSLLEEIRTHLNARCGSFGTPICDVSPFVRDITTLDEILAMTPPEVWVVVDHQITNSTAAECNTHALARTIHKQYAGKIKVSMHSGELPQKGWVDKHVILLAQMNGFCVLKARGTSTAGKVLPDIHRSSLNIINDTLGNSIPSKKLTFLTSEPVEKECSRLNDLHAELNCPIRNNFNQHYGSMGTDLDGCGNKTLTSECRTKTSKQSGK